MLCDKCHKREARIYCTEIVNGVKKEQYLCEECAAEYASFHLEAVGVSKEVNLGNLLSGLLDNVYKEEHKKLQESVKCKECGMTYEEFLTNGKFGCANCYEAFGKIFDKSLLQIQGSDKHIGKIPKNFMSKTEKVISEITEIDKMSLKLQDAVEKEEFEEAARLRDLIRELRKKEAEEVVNHTPGQKEEPSNA
ncbi:UvrB/UvrC motif-containing protein [Anaeromicropila populeti]|uniref:Protein-arginine kinase activator protein McsA n=1 Tax=Anaeromicropila populeti TaxID=37658 RepID=A0A1I6IRM5_9FIRM|nr:UvrB/UvrC motif-containing protein [Anaeromicropila populeti]SFR69406.1 Protein-arginine kinase activator protein McsA [Anaeromicropila populeti]